MEPGKESNIVAKRLRMARQQTGLSQKKLGILAGIDEFCASARINQYERGKHIPDIYMTERLAQVMNVPMCYLYCEDDEVAAGLLQWHQMTAQNKEKLRKLLQQMSMAE
ncbi:transcriptional regulator, XRE family [Methylophilus rhizosphaerae]|uniref:Transcriptional regulator, XRE family n=1 Tax=Methylophilus rhizosphaerae TaxID=492660 RepID=A0A1G9F3F4_9PROT|nr:helix-turn-helix transcriptional regulator [Methylophilus rhizosphaerae]SDK82944.1 transcriptional regulator, XRE family [Methylophilus rhizosphaerae]